MLNPSTATGEKLDPTTHKVTRMSKKWGFGGWEVVNAFAFRARNPKEMFNAQDPKGVLNNIFLINACHRSDIVCAAWSTMLPPAYETDLKQLLTRHADLYTMEISVNGHPKHPRWVKEHNELSLFCSKQKVLHV